MSLPPEDEAQAAVVPPLRPRRPRPGIPLRAVPANAITALALCFGLTAVRFAIGGEWEKAVGAIIVSGILDGLDGRIARMLKADSRFGAELDSLSDVIAFGVSPAIILYLWSLQFIPKYGWVIALAHALSCAMRLARFNARIDSDRAEPRKAAGFFTGVPAPAGAAMALLPLMLWLATDHAEPFGRTFVVAPWTLLTAILMVSQAATFSWGSIRLRRDFRMPALVVIGLIGAAVITSPWATLSVLVILYALAIPFAVRAYAKVRRRGARPAA